MQHWQQERLAQQPKELKLMPKIGYTNIVDEDVDTIDNLPQLQEKHMQPYEKHM